MFDLYSMSEKAILIHMDHCLQSRQLALDYANLYVKAKQAKTGAGDLAGADRLINAIVRWRKTATDWLVEWELAKKELNRRNGL